MNKSFQISFFGLETVVGMSQWEITYYAGYYTTYNFLEQIIVENSTNYVVI